MANDKTCGNCQEESCSQEAKHSQEYLEQLELTERMSQIKYKIIVLSGKGGVGKSTVAANLAVSLSLNGNRVGLLDVDIHGPSIAKMLGIEGKTLSAPSGQGKPGPVQVSQNIYALSIASLIENPDEPIVWRGPLKMGVIKQFLQDIEWPDLDFLIIDSPPGTGDEPLSVIQLIKNLSGSVVVSTPQDVALLDARKSIKFSQKLNVPSTYLLMNKVLMTGALEDLRKRVKDTYGCDLLSMLPHSEDLLKMGSSNVFYIQYPDHPFSKEIE